MLLLPDTLQSLNRKPFKSYDKCISLLLTKSHLFHLNPRTTEDERLLIRATPGTSQVLLVVLIRDRHFLAHWKNG